MQSDLLSDQTINHNAPSVTRSDVAIQLLRVHVEIDVNGLQTEAFAYSFPECCRSECFSLASTNNLGMKGGAPQCGDYAWCAADDKLDSVPCGQGGITQNLVTTEREPMQIVVAGGILIGDREMSDFKFFLGSRITGISTRCNCGACTIASGAACSPTCGAVLCDRGGRRLARSTERRNDVP